MTRLLFNENQNIKSKNSKESRFLAIINLLGRIIENNKLLFLSCSLLACLVATINFFLNYIILGCFSPVINSKFGEIRTKKVEVPKYLGDFLERIGFEKENFSLGSLALFLIAYTVSLKATFSVLQWYITSYSASKIEKDLKVELFEVLTGSSYERSSEISPKMLTQFSSDIDNIAYNIWTIPNRAIYVTVSLTLNIISFLLEKNEFSYPLVLVIFLLFFLFFSVILSLLRKSIKLSTEAKKRYESDNRFIFERISNLEYIKTASSEEFEKNKLCNHLDNTFEENKLSLIWSVLLRAIPDYLVSPNIQYLFIWVVSLNFFRDEISSLVSLSIYLNTISRIKGEVDKIFNSILSLEDLSSDFSILMDNVNFLSDGQSLNHEELESFTKGNIVFDDVTFAYPSRAQNKVIENFSFTFEKDKKYGIAGKNGIGKSTITKILLKLYGISAGRVLINQKDLSVINTADLHHNICRLNNRPSFFNMSIAENVFYPFLYEKSRDLKKLIYAAKETRIFNFIKSLPAGFDTVLREGGADLSEGQKQQLEAMKVFIREYKIYIFDEILSNVHPSTKRIILKNIFTKVKDELVISIDHHYDIFAHMDYIYRFSSKKLIPVRNFEKLLKNP